MISNKLNKLPHYGCIYTNEIVGLPGFGQFGARFKFGGPGLLCRDLYPHLHFFYLFRSMSSLIRVK